MERKNRVIRILTVIFAIIILGISVCNIHLVKEPICKFMHHEVTLKEFIGEVSGAYRSQLGEKNSFINLNGLFVRLTGGRISNEIVRLNNGQLTASEIEPYDVTPRAGSVAALSDYLSKKGTPFVYVQAPIKVDIKDLVVPEGIINAANTNTDDMLRLLTEKGVETIDLRTELADTPEAVSENFYVTDHHWTPVGAFSAYRTISAYIAGLKKEWEPAAQTQEIENWELHRKENWFLGSQGKRVGKYFAGTDDLIWLTPSFDTEISTANPYRDKFDYGGFSEANIHDEFIDKCDYFGINPYCLYIGGDYPLVRHRNPKAAADVKILVLKDSFTLPVQAFLSTAFSQVDVIDLRYYTAGTLSEYINDASPDAVVMLLTPTAVKTDEFFAYGNLSDENKKETAGNTVVAEQSVTVDASDDSYNHATLYDKLECGAQYTFSFDSASLLGSETGGFSLKLFDPDSLTVYLTDICDTAYCKAKGKYEWSFTVPKAVAKNMSLLVYSGIAGEAENKRLEINNLKLEK